MLKLFLLLICSTSISAQALAFDFSQPASIQQIRQVGQDSGSIIIRALAPTGLFDTNACNNIIHSEFARVKTSVYMSPSPSADAKHQVDLLNEGLYGCNMMYKSYWLQVINPLRWKDVASNIKFITEIINVSHNVYRQTVGIFTTIDDWNKITGGANITESSGLYHPLWYKGITNETNFDDFKSFGGWIAPYMKQYQTGVVDAQIVGNRNLYEQNDFITNGQFFGEKLQ